MMFIARQWALDALASRFHRSLEGNLGIAFVVGEAGQGKTALLQAFSEQIQRQHPNCIVARGNGNAYTGMGDPHLPFREVLESLIQESSDASGNQWDTTSAWYVGLQAIATSGIDLLDTFVAVRPLLEQISAQPPIAVPWFASLQARLQSLINQPQQTLQQKTLFAQYGRVLQRIAQQRPVVIMLDDLQWADSGSVDLLFYLGRQLQGGSPRSVSQSQRIFLVGAYRLSDVAIGQGGKRHPLQPIIHELQRQFGEIVIDLGQSEGAEFVNQLLDSEPNHLDAEFRQRLLRRTAGHPLFTLELLRAMQARGDLVRDETGVWMAQPTLDWTLLPARTEGAIAERIKRLDPHLQELVQVASVMGEEFIAEVVAQALNINEREAVRQFSQVLDQTHQLVQSLGMQRQGERRLSRYQFRHILVQQYLYVSLDEVERAYLNEAIAQALETLYGETDQDTHAIALQLAWHYEQSGLTAKATECLYQAGLRASRMAGEQVAIAHFQQALTLLTRLHDTGDRQQLELNLQVALATSLIRTQSYAASAVGAAYTRALALCNGVGDPLQRFLVLSGLWVYHLSHSDIEQARQLAEECWQFAQASQNPTLLMVSAWMQAEAGFISGDFVTARNHSAYSLQLYQTWQRPPQADLYSQDPGVSLLVQESCTLWHLGYADQAIQRSQAGIALAQQLDHTYSLAFAHFYSAMMYQYRGDVEKVARLSRDQIELATEAGFSTLAVSGRFMQGWAIAHQGNCQTGLEQMQRALADWQALETEFLNPYMLMLVADVQRLLGQLEAALTSVETAIDYATEKLQGICEADSYRLKGELLLQQKDNATQAEALFEQAIAIAQRRQARFQELRAVVSLSRLWQRQGKVKALRSRLSSLYHQFTEGFDTPDLQTARTLLESLGETVSPPSASNLDVLPVKSELSLSPELSNHPPNAAFLERLVTLTDRERELLNLIAQGLSNTQISEQLFISPKTVRNHITHIFSKLDVATRAEAIVQARNAGLG